MDHTLFRLHHLTEPVTVPPPLEDPSQVRPHVVPTFYHRPLVPKPLKLRPGEKLKPKPNWQVANPNPSLLLSTFRRSSPQVLGPPARSSSRTLLLPGKGGWGVPCIGFVKAEKMAWERASEDA